MITMEIEYAGTAIRKIGFMVNGERWTAHDPHAAIYQRDDGLWMVGWKDGAAGPVESRQFAQAVADAMREGVMRERLGARS
jgi:hypothetical protein